MMVSTKGRYALRVMIDLAENTTGDYIVLMDIAKRQDISEKYLEGILSTLSKGGMVHALRGRGGGYRLARLPEQYTVGSILKLTEKTLAPIACLKTGSAPCDRSAECRTLPMWERLHKLVDDFLEDITLADLMAEGACADYYVI